MAPFNLRTPNSVNFLSKLIDTPKSIDLVWLNMSNKRKWSMDGFLAFIDLVESSGFYNLQEMGGDIKVWNVYLISIIKIQVK